MSLPFRAVLTTLPLLLATAFCRAESADPAPYRPTRQVSGTLHSWGHAFLKPVMHEWEQAFVKFQPQVTFDDNLASSAAALAGLYSGRADLGLLAREITPAEAAAYQKMTRQKLRSVAVLTGSYSNPDKVMALALFVHPDNPLAGLTSDQLDRLFSGERRQRDPHRLVTWDQLGVTGPLAGQPIHFYSGPVTEAAELYFAQTVLHGTALWNDQLRQSGDTPARDGYRRVVDAVAQDPLALGLSSAGYADERVRALSLDGVAPTRENVTDGAYLLSRPVRFYLNAGDAQPPSPLAVEFLRFILSREGQAAAAREGDFIPLTGTQTVAQRRALEAMIAPELAIPSPAGLRLVAKIPLPEMSGTWDHLSCDGPGGRLFLSAQEDHAVDVVDLRAECFVRRISGGFNRPQGEYYVTSPAKLVITNGRDGACRFFAGDTLEPEKTLTLSLGADMIDYDPAAAELYVESGGRDSKRGPGKLTVIDVRTEAAVAEIVTDFRAAAMALERQGPRLFVALPGANQVAIVDRPSRRITARFALPGRPASMALDEAGRRLFVATRTFPGSPAAAEFLVLNADTGALLARLPSSDATENMFYDAAHHRIYTSSLEGTLQVFRQDGPDGYTPAASVPTFPHAGTAQFVPEMKRLCVALPPAPGRVAQVWVFATGP